MSETKSSTTKNMKVALFTANFGLVKNVDHAKKERLNGGFDRDRVETMIDGSISRPKVMQSATFQFDIH